MLLCVRRGQSPLFLEVSVGDKASVVKMLLSAVASALLTLGLVPSEWAWLLAIFN